MISCLLPWWTESYQKGVYLEGKNMPLEEQILFLKSSLPLRRMVGCFGFSSPLRQYFRLYQAVSQREGERGEKGQRRIQMSKQPPPTPKTSAVGPCPTMIQIVGRPGTGSLPRTMAQHDHPYWGGRQKENVVVAALKVYPLTFIIMFLAHFPLPIERHWSVCCFLQRKITKFLWLYDWDFLFQNDP